MHNCFAIVAIDPAYTQANYNKVERRKNQSEY